MTKYRTATMDADGRELFGALQDVLIAKNTPKAQAIIVQIEMLVWTLLVIFPDAKTAIEQLDLMLPAMRDGITANAPHMDLLKRQPEGTVQ